jgi:hypothetical protein
MKMYKAWLLKHDAGTLVHISDDTIWKEDVQRLFPEYEVSELRPSTTERTFRLHIRTEVEVLLS